MKDIKTPSVDEFFSAILTLESVEECYKYFGGVCTPKEIQAIAQRFTVARMLKEKKVYSEIVAATGASTATISRVNRSFCYGKDGYKNFFEKLDSLEK